jgi:hypothetical protein
MAKSGRRLFYLNPHPCGQPSTVNLTLYCLFMKLNKLILFRRTTVLILILSIKLKPVIMR